MGQCHANLGRPAISSATAGPGHRVVVRRSRTAAILLLLLSQGIVAGGADTAAVVSTYVGTGEAGISKEGELRYRAAIAEPYGLACDAAGHLYFSDYENGRVGRVDRRSGAVTTVALVPSPQGLALDGQRGLYVGAMTGEVWRVELDTGAARVVAGGGPSQAATGVATSMALGEPAGLAIDASGLLYIADAALHVVLRLDPRSGELATVAGLRGAKGFSGDGGSARAARLNAPGDVAVDASGTLYVADADNHVIRTIDAATGAIRTLTGTPGEAGFAGDGRATGIRFHWPQELQLSDDGTLLVADVFNHRVRAVDLRSGIVRTVAGTGGKTYAAENVAVPGAVLPYPYSVALDPDGAIYVSTPRAQRILRIGEPFIAPRPWWMSPWSWLAVVLALGALMLAVADGRARHLRRRSVALEREIARRTRELDAQRAAAQTQADWLAKLAAAKSRLLTGLSGEFHSPLEQMRHVASAASGDEDRCTGVVRRNTRRLLRLVEQMRHLTRPAADLAPSAVGALPARGALVDVVTNLEPAATARGITLGIGTLADLSLRTNPEAFELIAVNLLSNAIKYTPSGGTVQVSLTRVGEMGMLVVDDTGRGIAPDAQARVFLPFERAHDEGERIPGSGLGLALVKEQAQAHGGRVELDSTPGVGSTFRVFLPLATATDARADRFSRGTLVSAEREFLSQPDAPAVAVAGPVAPATAAVTILVAEDHPDMRRYLLEVLAPHYQTLSCDDGHAAVSLAREHVPDLVVCDVVLPGQDGFAVCRALKHDERTSHIPVVLLTALGDQQNRLMGYAGLADEYLGKPFDEAELLLRLRNLAELRRMLQRRYARDLRFDRVVPKEMNARDGAFLGKLGRVVARRHGEAALDSTTLAAELAISERQLQRKLKALTGLTPGEFLRDYRLLRAHERLLQGERVGDAAFASGFASPAHFAACFKARFGYSPGETRARARNRA